MTCYVLAKCHSVPDSPWPADHAAPFLPHPSLLPEVPHGTQKPQKQEKKRKPNPTTSGAVCTTLQFGLPSSPCAEHREPRAGAPPPTASWGHLLLMALIRLRVCPRTEPSGTPDHSWLLCGSPGSRRFRPPAEPGQLARAKSSSQIRFTYVFSELQSEPQFPNKIFQT